MELNTLYNENCFDTLKRMGDNSIDSIVTDPPYELGFMGKSWDNTGIAYNVELWKECLRVLKPGGHLLAFSGSRTYHRMACAIEDAGFEVRDMIEWVYGSGFPKSLNISKSIDKQAGADRTVVIGERHRNVKPFDDVQNEWNQNNTTGDYQYMAPATLAAKQWDGWGTALKPAHEPICMARKPIGEKTVADNVIKYGTGGINIDGCRVSHDEELKITNRTPRTDDNVWSDKTCGIKKELNNIASASPMGRFPANLIHDGSPEVVAMFPITTSGKAQIGTGTIDCQNNGIYGSGKGGLITSCFADSGSAARFFYCAKTSQAERNMGCGELEEVQQDDNRKDGNPGGDNPRNRGLKKRSNNHPTVKPIALMLHLITMVTQPSGITYDPFSGSGSTLCAAKQGGFSFIGSELQPEYVEIAYARIAAAVKEQPKQSPQLEMEL